MIRETIANLRVGVLLAVLIAVSGCSEDDGTTGPSDVVAPGSITDLATTTPTMSSVTLTWTAPGNDGTTGKAAQYDVRYSHAAPIDPSNWNSATTCAGEPAPGDPGAAETYTVSPLIRNRPYYFGVKTADEAGNWSELSNIVLRQTANGTVAAWGSNSNGQCEIPGPGPNELYRDVAAGTSHSLGLTGGNVIAWGSNSTGQCDVPGPVHAYAAIAANGDNTVGSGHSLGLKNDGTIAAWGSNEHGQCDVPTPNIGFSAVAAGGYHCMGLKSNGTIVAWGHNYYGQCDVPAPNADFVAISAGWEFSLGLKSDGMIVAWGRNNREQCELPSPNADFVAIAAGGWHGVGLKSDGTVEPWGYNSQGQSNHPAVNSDIVAISAGSAHSVALRSDGRIIAWGDNSRGQSDVPAPNANFVAISAGGIHTLAIK